MKLKTFEYFGMLILTASLAVSCANRGSKTADTNNPYSSNPYYTGDSSSSASSAGSAQYPTYDDSAAYNPPPSPSADETPATYPSYSGSDNNSYPSYTGSSSNNANPYTGSSGVPSTNTGATTHTVAKGENLYRISLQYGTSVSSIQAANGMSDVTIYPGQVLQIP